MGNKTTRTGFYSKDTPPPIVSAPQRRVVTGLAPWLRQAQGGGTPSSAIGGGGSKAWYDQQIADANAASAAAREQREAQLRQAELLRQQQLEAARAPENYDPYAWDRAYQQAQSVSQDPNADTRSLTEEIYKDLMRNESGGGD